MEPSSGMLSFKLWDFTKDMAESNIIPISLMALSDASLGNSFIMSTSVLRSFPLRSTGEMDIYIVTLILFLYIIKANKKKKIENEQILRRVSTFFFFEVETNNNNLH